MVIATWVELAMARIDVGCALKWGWRLTKCSTRPADGQKRGRMAQQGRRTAGTRRANFRFSIAPLFFAQGRYGAHGKVQGHF